VWQLPPFVDQPLRGSSFDDQKHESHKILLAAALVVAVAFACFILFNDYRQREALQQQHRSLDAELAA
jgi:methyl-accepting chemotaxis protein